MQKKDSILASALAVAATVSVALTYRIVFVQQKFADIDFGALQKKICGDEAPSFLWLFDLSSAPGLLLYAYMPMAAIATLFALLLLQRKHRSQKSAMLVTTLALFVLWILCILAQWLASYHTVLLFAWQLIAMLEIGLYIAAFYFAYFYINDRDLPYWAKCVLAAILFGTLALTPTVLNIPHYRPEICAGTTDSPLWTALYFIVEPALIVAIVGAGISAWRSERNASRRPHIALYTFSFAFFMAAFAVSNYFGEITTDYEMNFWGPLGLLVCLLMSGYMVMQKLRFHWHTVVAQMLVWGLVTLIGMQFFYIDGASATPFILNSAAFLATIVFGLMMIRSATAEIRQKETEDALRRQLASVNRLATVKLRDVLTRNKFTFTGLGTAAGTASPDEVRAKAFEGTAQIDEGLAAINDVLSAESLKNKTVTLAMNAVDLRNVVLSAVTQLRPSAEKKQLTVTAALDEANFTMLGDEHWLREMVKVFIDNAIRYTPSGGTITIGLTRIGTSGVLTVRDTGIGIPTADMNALFTEGGRGSASAKTNPDSMGYGLFLAKLVAEASRGRTWVESAEGQGSTFFVELPLLG